ncbi:hypothetical protein EJB05_09466, partial [Eragrostis curvula]
MRLAAAVDQEEGNKEIVVLYRYTRFSKTWSGARGVEALSHAVLRPKPNAHLYVCPGSRFTHIGQNEVTVQPMSQD